jgi:TP901 family phage tail tape measure protein
VPDSDIDLAVVMRLRDDLTRKFNRVSTNFKRQSVQMAGSMDRVRASVRRVIGVLGGFFAVRATFRATVGGAAALQTEIAKIGTLGEEAAASLDRFKAGVLDIGQRTGEEFTDLAKGMFEIVSAGIPAAGALKVLGDAADLAVAGATTTDVATRGLIGTLKGFELETKASRQVADALFAAMQKGRTTFAELAAAIGQVTAPAKAAGLSLKETLAAITTITLKTGDTTQAVTQLNSVLAGVARAGREAELQSKGFVRFMQDLGEETGKSTEKLLELLGRQEAQRGVQNLLINDGRDFVAILQEVAEATGTVSRESDRMGSTFERTARRARRTLEASLVRIGDQILPRLAPAIERVAHQVSEFLDRNRENVDRFVETVTGALKRFGAELGRVLIAIAPLLDEFLSVIQVKLGLFVSRLSGLALVVASAFRGGLFPAQLLDALGLTPADNRLDEMIEKVEEIQAKLLDLTVEGGRQAAGGALRILAPENAQAALDDLLRNLGLLRTDELPGTGKAGQKAGDDIADGMDQAADRTQKLADAAERVQEALDGESGRPKLSDVLAKVAAAEIPQFQRDVVADFLRASEILTEFENRLSVLALPEGLAREVQEVRLDFFALNQEISKLNVPQEVFDQLAQFSEQLEQLELEEVKRKFQETFDFIGDAVRSTGQRISAFFADLALDVENSFRNTRAILHRFLTDLSRMFLQAGFAQLLSIPFPGLFPARAAAGGVFQTAGGAVMPVRPMQGGGIVTRPEVVLRGEAGPEAVVPLPGSRKIPVELRGAAGSMVNVSLGPIQIGGGSDFLSLPQEKQIQLLLSHIERGLKGRWAQAIAARVRGALI